ncbi:hypothetical protein B0T25DRAFT_442960 [Lasiosphaeria hispida]|uniref:JmjC domain-containing protein n=1 Tax=Lasiosphaeria hispida TaxID=260671 RepID=A0AAJ0HVJ8_9PEZI|nr:hypothetical protein B0T25DRAFT_442960 [Lasiosphaeria hispida]
MDALQGRVDSIGSEVRQIGDALRGYLNNGATATRKVKPPGTKAGRDLLQHLLGRLDQVSTELVDVQKLSSNVSPPLPNNGPDTPLSYGSPVPLPPPTHPQDGPDGLHDGTHPHPVSHGSHTESHAHSHSHPHPHPESGSRSDQHTQAQTRFKPTSPPADHRITAPLSRSLPPPTTTSTPISSQVKPQLSEHSSPLFPCRYQDIHVLNEELFEQFSRHPVVKSRGYFKLQVQDLPPVKVAKMTRPSKDHATSFCYKTDPQGLIKVDTGKRVRFSSPRLPFPRTVRAHWSVQAQRDLWNSTALDPPQGTRPYIIGNPLFDDVELSPGEKLRQRGRTALEGINTQYVYFNLTGKTITTMHREDAHVRSENLLRSGENKFWCFVKPSFTGRLEHHMRLEYPEMRGCSQAVRHLSRHIPPAKLDEWGVEYTLDYCVPGQAVVTEPGTYHQVLNLGPNYAVAINLEYLSSPDMPSGYTFCDDNCPDKFAISAEDFAIFRKPGAPLGSELSHESEAAAPQPAQERKQEQKPSTVYEGPRSSQPQPQPAQKLGPGPEKPPPAYPKTAAPPPVQTETPVANQPPQGEPRPTEPPLSQAITPPAERSLPEILEPTVPQPTQRDNARPKTSVPITPELAQSQLPQAAAPSLDEGLPDKTKIQDPATLVNQTWVELQPQVSTPQEIFAPRQDVGPGLRPKTAEVPSNKRPAATPPVKKAPKKQKPDSSLLPVTPMALESPRRAAYKNLATLVQSCQQARVGTLAAARVCGRPEFDRIDRLVKDWRAVSRSIPHSGNILEFVNHVDKMMHSDSEIEIFLRRFSKMMLAEAAENNGKVDGRNRTSAEFMDQLLANLGWRETDRPKLYDYVREGKCWKTICNNNDGLLCVMPLDTHFLDIAMYRDEVAHFHSQQLGSKFVWGLASVGSQLQISIRYGRELSEFVWESENTIGLTPDELCPLLQPFQIIKMSLVNPRGVDWPRPARWLWDWPTDPTLIAPGDRHCNMCKRKKNCQCFRNNVSEIPRLSIDGSKGPGVRSLGTYKAGQLLGELLGELAPVGTYHNEWAMEFRHPDLDHEPVAEICPRRFGNWVRKVNHSLEPSAEFRVIKISGRWRQMLVALRDIKDGEEITARCGRGYQRRLPYHLVEGFQ